MEKPFATRPPVVAVVVDNFDCDILTRSSPYTHERLQDLSSSCALKSQPRLAVTGPERSKDFCSCSSLKRRHKTVPTPDMKEIFLEDRAMYTYTVSSKFTDTSFRRQVSFRNGIPTKVSIPNSLLLGYDIVVHFNTDCLVGQKSELETSQISDDAAPWESTGTSSTFRKCLFYFKSLPALSSPTQHSRSVSTPCTLRQDTQSNQVTFQATNPTKSPSDLAILVTGHFTGKLRGSSSGSRHPLMPLQALLLLIRQSDSRNDF
ncbi:hypothetical protein D9758_006645 [Tetrapyrgos nigripes]|uniref:Uncharacterized protein n=1 Tax=Tetrapyrgos nigripes TaxID=182062 RepID=A0A8H5GJ81_9AGAR|nr:hypothetical protein D9758_006645 [Tetrapyrgos nigripes]